MYSTSTLLKEGPVDVQRVFLIRSKLFHPFDHVLQCVPCVFFVEHHTMFLRRSCCTAGTVMLRHAERINEKSEKNSFSNAYYYNTK